MTISVQPKIYFQADHGIDPVFVDADAIYVITKLREAGFLAYLVGGSVRDLLVKRTPKDFDISTSAQPEQIKRIFQRRCILIGRRFRLAHIRFGHKILEVSTFRSGENDSDLIVQDNEWGSPQEDVLRRDFTINGLFYDPATQTVIDYVDGWEDVRKGVLRTIGEPQVRFRQDPVRMIRLVKFQARFNFLVDPDTHNALRICRQEIVKSSPARLLEEILRMLESGAAASFFRIMIESHLLEQLFPSLNTFLTSPAGERSYRFLDAIDKLHCHTSRPLDRSLLTAALLYPIVEDSIKKELLRSDIIPHIGEITLLTNSLIKEFVIASFSHFPRRLTALAASIVAMQYRLTPLSGRKHHRPKLMRSKEFDLAMEFFYVRTLVDHTFIEEYQAWLSAKQHLTKTAEYHGHHQHTQSPAAEAPEPLPPLRRHRRRQDSRRASPPHH